jgi:two-component system, LytTR family, sensor histidine kinase AlgZ
MASIREKGQDAGVRWRQNLHVLRLPDFCNLGTWLRVLIAVNALAMAATAWRGNGVERWLLEFSLASVYIEPTVLLALVSLCAAQRRLAALPGLIGGAVVVGVAAAAGWLCAALVAWLDPDPAGRIWLWSGLTAAVLLAWFDLAIRARSPAVTEAKMMALTARIRPHFLFNSLNAVLGIMRAEPRRAEAALEELAELFRVLMRDNRELVPLSEEIALARQYLGIERLRLGERLSVRWDVDACPPDALVPPLMLQPLLENAVYHGIEPLAAGEIVIRLARQDDRVLIELTNPCPLHATNGGGNHMALANIRERLLLFFDLEATLDTTQEGEHYRVVIRLPYRRRSAS